MRRVLFLTAFIAVSTSANAAPDDPNAKDLIAMQGIWQLIATVHDGAPKPADVYGKKSFWTIAKNKVIYPPPLTPEGKPLDYSEEHEIIIDATMKPKAMDIRIARKGEKPTDLKAIYTLTGDELKICVDIANKGRPDKFESSAGSGRRLVTLKRLNE